MALTTSETLLYTTIKLNSSVNGNPLRTGTGFFFRFSKDELWGDVIITNKHVISGASDITAMCHIARDDNPSGQFLPITISTSYAIEHPAENIDLCALPFTPIVHIAEQNNISLFFRQFDASLIPSTSEWTSFDAIEEVTMIGCPRGIWDESNNLPIVRKGITASSLSKKYNGNDEFMVDMACFPGSSGSPVIIYDRNGYFDRAANSYVIGGSRLKLVGILYSGPLFTNSGQLILAQAPRIEVSSMMHLGNAIRSTALLDLRDKFFNTFPPSQDKTT